MQIKLSKGTRSGELKNTALEPILGIPMTGLTVLS